MDIDKIARAFSPRRLKQSITRRMFRWILRERRSGWDRRARASAVSG